MWTSRDVDDLLHETLLELFMHHPELFPPDIQVVDDVIRRYQSFRTFRRSSDTQALERKVSSNDIDIVNKWRTIEETHGKRLGRSNLALAP